MNAYGEAAVHAAKLCADAPQKDPSLIYSRAICCERWGAQRVGASNKIPKPPAFWPERSKICTDTCF